jgi:hypothetical protein
MEPEELYRSSPFKEYVKKSADIQHISETVIHRLSHQVLHARFIHIHNADFPSGRKLIGIKKKDISNYGMPQLLVKYAERNF